MGWLPPYILFYGEEKEPGEGTGQPGSGTRLLGLKYLKSRAGLALYCN